MLEEYNSNTEAIEILPGLFLGTDVTCISQEFFQRHNIIRIVNCTPDIPINSNIESFIYNSCK